MRTCVRMAALVATLTCIPSGTCGPPTRADASPSPAGIEFFEKKIRPVLVEHCYACHSREAKKVRGGLLLDHRDGLRKGGDSGPVIVPGNPGKSLLVRAVRYVDESIKMPPRGKLPQALIADLEAWIEMDAPDPRGKPASSGPSTTWVEMLKDRRQWWSLQPVRKPGLPAVKDANWSAHPVDRFILAALEGKGLVPAGTADPRTILRRLSLVLTGLPPTPQEIEEFSGQAGSLPYEKVVDRLLGSPHFGERWARHWMDVVRFSETHGNEWNYEVHHAWRYRDYLIRAFNDDVPYDQLVREHIAGDLMPRPRWNRNENFNESVIGTAFYRFGEVNHDDCIDLRSIGYDLADNQIDTLSKAFQATTVACARCHDHKIDALSTKDYYALLGVLRSSRQVSHTIDAADVNAQTMARMRLLKADIRQELGKIWIAEAQQVGKYLLAAQAKIDKQTSAAALAQGLDAARIEALLPTLQAKSGTLEDPLEPWRLLARSENLPQAARESLNRYVKESQQRAKDNERFTPMIAFAAENRIDWQVAGHGLRDGPGKAGDFIVHPTGEALVQAVLPAGFFTHALSSRLNGTLRSPVLDQGGKHISFQVMGQGQSAVRLVSNNCQLNYRNYKALTKDELQWVTFRIPEDASSLRVYAELMTKFDNPKFPDQLGTLGGDTSNQRASWDKAAADPRSHFGITRVVLHDEPSPPRADLGPVLLALTLDGLGPKTGTEELAARYQSVIAQSAAAWLKDSVDDAALFWLKAALRHGLLSNRVARTPRLEQLTRDYRELEASLSLPRIVPGLADCGPGFDQPVFVRGDCMKPGDTVPRRYLEVLATTEDRFPSHGSGRLELAERIARASNPLTARVMVNRIWHHLFGSGLVRTVDDFGRVGELPSHPELLDYLAARFVDEGWSIKRLIRMLVLTRTFQMSHQPTVMGRQIDPSNRLLHHYPARRLEAEGIRDAILAASGRLDRTLFGPSVLSYRAQENADRRLFAGPLDGDGRRSIYIRNTLMEAPHFLGVFDFPAGKVGQGRRDVTNVPAQALALLNDPFVLQQADVWAKKLLARTDATPASRIEAMFPTALGRPPTADEVKRFVEAAEQFANLQRVPADGMLSSQAVWRDLAQALFNLKEFIYIP